MYWILELKFVKLNNNIEFIDNLNNLVHRISYKYIIYTRICI